MVGLSLWLSWQRIRLQCGRPGIDPLVGKIPWRRERLPIPVFWPREFHRLYSPWGCKESDDWATFTFTFLWSMYLKGTAWGQRGELEAVTVVYERSWGAKPRQWKGAERIAVVLVAESCLTLLWPCWTVTLQAPLSMGLSGQDYWSGLPVPPPGDLPDLGIEPSSPYLLHCRRILYHWATMGEETPQKEYVS